VPVEGATLDGLLASAADDMAATRAASAALLRARGFGFATAAAAAELASALDEGASDVVEVAAGGSSEEGVEEGGWAAAGPFVGAEEDTNSAALVRLLG
jgi:hypothetical protein